MKDLGKGALGIVLVVIIITIGAIVLDEFNSTIQTLDGTTTLTVTNETGWINRSTNGYQLSCANYDGFGSISITYAVNVSSNTGIDSANFSVDQTTAIVSNATANGVNYDWVNFTYTFTRTSDRTLEVMGIIGNTTEDISDTTDFFGIIITITAMVVLILLTVIIIRAIRGSGLIAEGGMRAPRETA